MHAAAMTVGGISNIQGKKACTGWRMRNSLSYLLSSHRMISATSSVSVLSTATRAMITAAAAWSKLEAKGARFFPSVCQPPQIVVDRSLTRPLGCWYWVTNLGVFVKFCEINCKCTVEQPILIMQHNILWRTGGNVSCVKGEGFGWNWQYQKILQ